MVGTLNPVPGGKLNLNPDAARFTWVTVSLAFAEMFGSRVLSSCNRMARAARCELPAVIGPRFAASARLTASASESWDTAGPVGTLPAYAPLTETEVDTVLAPVCEALW